MHGFGERLRARARLLGMSDAEVARRVGLGERRYAHYVTDSREPDLATLLRISQALATTPNALLGVESEPSTDHPRAIAALNALDEDGRRLAVALLETMAEHRHGRSG